MTPQSAQAWKSSAASRWVQESLSRESIAAGIKTISWLVPLTLLIWVYAERSQVIVTPPPGEAIPIGVRSSDPGKYYVELKMPENDRSVIAQFSGPQARIDEVRRLIAPQVDNPSVVLTIDSSLPPGLHELDTVQYLSQNPTFGRTGVSVTNPKPARIPVYVDAYVDEEVEVRVPPTVQNLNSPPTFTPAKVTVRAPSKMLEEARLQGPLVVYANLEATGALSQPGQRDDVVAKIYAPALEGRPVLFSHPSVKASLDVRQSESEGTIRSLPINIIGQISIINEYRVQTKDNVMVLSNVPILAPPERIEAIKREEEPRPRAVLRISSTDQPGVFRSAPLEIQIPDPQVRLDPKYIPRQIEYRLVPKNADQ